MTSHFIAKSINNAKIHLSDERWQHIKVRHPKLSPIGKKGIINAIEHPKEIWQHIEDISFFVAIKD